MVSINYTSDQLQQINDLKAQIQQYCESHGIDPSAYTQYLNDGKAFDVNLAKDPGFQAYWQLAYLQLMEILYPEVGQSLQGQVGDVDFNKIFSAAGDEINERISKYIQDNPNLMAFAALSDNDPKTAAKEVFDKINAYLASEEGQKELGVDKPIKVTDEQARKLKKELGLKDGMYDYLISQEEGLQSTEKNLMLLLSDMDAEFNKITQSFQAGDIDADVYKGKLEQFSANKTIVTSLVMRLDEAVKNMVEMFAKLVSERNEGQKFIINKWGGGLS